MPESNDEPSSGRRVAKYSDEPDAIKLKTTPETVEFKQSPEVLELENVSAPVLQAQPATQSPVSGAQTSTTQTACLQDQLQPANAALKLPSWFEFIASFILYPIILLNLLAIASNAFALVPGPAKLFSFIYVGCMALAVIPGMPVVYWCIYVRRLHQKLRSLAPDSKVWSPWKAIIANCLQGWGLMTATGLLLAGDAFLISAIFADSHSLLTHHTVTASDRWMYIRNLVVATFGTVVVINVVPGLVGLAVYKSFGTVVEQINGKFGTTKLSRMVPIVIALMIALPPWLTGWSAGGTGNSSFWNAFMFFIPAAQLYAFAQLRSVISAANEAYGLTTEKQKQSLPWKKAILVILVMIISSGVAGGSGAYQHLQWMMESLTTHTSR
jgi:hypothetical protein